MSRPDPARTPGPVGAAGAPDEAGVSGAVLAVALGAVFLVVLVVGLGTVFVLRLGQDAAARTDVAVRSVLSPTEDGVRVRAEVTAVDGSLPPTLRVSAEAVQGDLASPVSDVRINARSRVLTLRVDGREVTPGARFPVSGGRVLLEYELSAADADGHRVAYSLVGVDGIRPRRVEVTVEGSPLTCEVPVGVRASDPQLVWTRPCPGPTVSAERAVPRAQGYQRVETPAWVRVDFGPA